MNPVKNRSGSNFGDLTLAMQAITFLLLSEITLVFLKT